MSLEEVRREIDAIDDFIELEQRRHRALTTPDQP